MKAEDTPKAASQGLTGENGSIALELVVSLVITGWVWFELWQGTVPSIEYGVALFVAVGIGLVLGIILTYMDEQGIGRRYMENNVSFMLIMSVLIGVGFLLFPEGLSASSETGLLVLVWSGVVARAFFVYIRNAN
jgi:hypothetical protein